MPHWRRPVPKPKPFKWPKPGEPGYADAISPNNSYVLLHFRKRNPYEFALAQGFSSVKEFIDAGGSICGTRRTYREDVGIVLAGNGMGYQSDTIFSATPFTYESVEVPEGYVVGTEIPTVDVT